MTDYLSQFIDPYAQTEPTTDPYGTEESTTDVPVSAISDPWSDIGGTEAGIDVQGEGVTPTEESYALQDPGAYQEQYGAARGYARSPQAIQMKGGRQPIGRMALKAGLTTLGTSAAITGVSAAYGAYTGQTAGQAAGGAAGSQAGGQIGSQGAGQGGGQGSSVGVGTALSRGAQFYAGYQAAPLGAYYARESGDPSPYYAGNAEGGLFQTMGGRNDKEANQAHGERTSMTAAGFAAGAMSGGWAGGLAGAVGAQFAENPYSGKRGYQEEWKYNIKPIGKGFGGEVKSLYSGQLPQRGNLLRNVTDFKNYGKAFDFHAGSGPKPPKKSEMKKDISREMAQRISMDVAVREWWNQISEKGGEAGREWVKSSLATEGRERGTEEGLPDWLQGKWGSGDHPYDYRPEYINGKMVAPSDMSKQLGALQNLYESVGDKKKFYDQYMKNWNIYSEGGSPIRGSWHSKELYNIPSEVGGKTFADIFPDLDTSQELTDYSWYEANQEEEVQV